MSAIRSGYLIKEGAVRRNWKRRWFVLTSTTLSYFKTDKDVTSKKELGFIPLKEVISTFVIPVYKKQPNCLCLSVPKRTYYLVTDTEQDSKEWLEAIQKQVVQCQASHLEGRDATVQNGRITSDVDIQTEGANFLSIVRPVWDTSNTLHAGMTPSAFKPPNKINSSDLSDVIKPSEVPSHLSLAIQNLDLGPDSQEKVSLDDFEMLTVIGQGSFGKVVQVRHKTTDQIYAMKILNKLSIMERGEAEHTKAEKQILQTISHPFLMCMHYSFQTWDKLFLVMDFVNGGEIFYRLQQERVFSNNRVLFYIAEIVLGLEYLHEHGIVYRDLKPENILLDFEGHIKMTDFGLSKQGLNTPDARTKTFCGTPEYLAPEVLQGKPYGKAVDWWSLGTLIFEMLTGLPPFYDEDMQQMYVLKLSGNLEYPDYLDSQVKDLISKLLERDPEKRLSDHHLIKAHPWFSTINWDGLLKKKIKPPYKPPVTDRSSIICIDEAFLEMTLSDVTSKARDPGQSQAHFEDFTYQAHP